MRNTTRDVGIKITQPGNDIGTDDTNLAFSSSWPVVRAIKLRQLDRPDFSTQTIPHNLGYPPLVISYQWAFNNGISLNALDMGDEAIYVDDTNIYWLPQSISSIVLAVLEVDISTAYNAPGVHTGNSSFSSSHSSVGIKFSKPNKDVTSLDLDDFILHSSARSPMLHAVAPVILDSNGSASYTHDLPYNPIFFAFSSATGSLFKHGVAYHAQNGTFSGGLAAQTNGNIISINNGLAGLPASFVIFKDPFDIDDNIINVTVRA